MMNFLKKAYDWTSSHIVVVLSVLGAAAVLLFALFKKKDLSISDDFEKPHDISEDLQEAEHLKGYKEALKEHITEVEETVKKTDDNISDIDKEIEETKSDVESMDSSQKLDKFEELGY